MKWWAAWCALVGLLLAEHFELITFPKVGPWFYLVPVTAFMGWLAWKFAHIIDDQSDKVAKLEGRVADLERRADFFASEHQTRLAAERAKSAP